MEPTSVKNGKDTNYYFRTVLNSNNINQQQPTHQNVSQFTKLTQLDLIKTTLGINLINQIKTLGYSIDKELINHCDNILFLFKEIGKNNLKKYL